LHTNTTIATGTVKTKKEGHGSRNTVTHYRLIQLDVTFSRQPRAEVGTEDAIGTRCTDTCGAATKIDKREKLAEEAEDVDSQSDSSLSSTSSFIT
jgi:hypothetical protein